MKLYDINVVNSIKDVLISKNETLAIAESVTSGHVQAAFSLADNATLFYQGGITAYHLGQKYRHLQIDPIYAERVNCVSERMAFEMALNVIKLFSSDYGIAITGYASKIPELAINELFAFAAIAKENKLIGLKKFTSNKSSMLDAQLDFTNQFLSHIASCLKKTGE
jgi:nicotinamide-nucleotide amidase